MKKSYILCVDDESVILRSMKSQLKQHYGNRFSYEFAESASEAFEILDEFNDDNINSIVIISDWLMPGVKGDEFLINAYKKYPHIKSILLTGQADGMAVQRAKEEAYLHKLIHKPWNKNELFNAIDSAFQKNNT